MRLPAVYKAAVDDNKGAFLGLLNAKCWTHKTILHILQVLIFKHAVKCTEALFEVELGLIVDDINPSFQRNFGLPPLHFLALSISKKMMNLLLQKGASANHRIPANIRRSTCAPYARMLAINVALLNILQSRFIKPWTTQQSVFNLILRLCSTGDTLQCLKLLASEAEGIDDEIYHYFLEGKVIELAVLMLADHKTMLSFFQRICCSNPASGSRTPLRLRGYQLLKSN